jgi:dihydroflavonol-4-reductase
MVPSTIALTGATGYIGGALAERLVARGHRVRALVRPTSRTERLERLGASLAVGDLADTAALERFAHGSDIVVHAAAELDFDAPLAAMTATNVTGSERLAEAVSRAGVVRLVAFSSIAAYGGSPADGSPATEGASILRPLPSNYAATKLAGQEALEHAAAALGLRLEQVHPSLVYGPPAKRGGANGLLRQIARGQMPAIVGADRLASWIYLEDLVDAVARLIEMDDAPKRLLLAGEAVTVRELVTKVCRLAGRPVPRLSLPLPLAKALAAALGPLFRFGGRRSPLSLEQLRNLARHWNFDDSAARQLLDWQPRPLDAGLPPTIDHLLSRTHRAA